MTEIIKKIIEAGTKAPSGDNCQPWRFKVAGNKIEVYNVPERDQSLYNFRQNASLVALGGLIENMAIMSFDLGYTLQISLLPDADETNLVARCILEPVNEKAASFLGNYIKQRTTNRKPYEDLPLTNDQINNILSITKELTGSEVRLAAKSEDRQALSNLLSRNEKIVLENKGLHNFLFNHIRWTEDEEKQKKDGLYIKTLELGPPQTVGFRLFRYWPVAKILNSLGVANKVAAENAGIYYRSAAFAAFIIPNSTSIDFLNAGRLMQRVWLKITALGLSAQPLTGITFLHQRLLAGEDAMFTGEQKEIIKNSYQGVADIFGAKSGAIATILRLGRGGAPSATSSRLEPEIALVD